MHILFKLFHLRNIQEARSMPGLAAQVTLKSFATVLLSTCTLLLTSVIHANQVAPNQENPQSVRLSPDQNEAAWRTFNIETVERYVIPNYEKLSTVNNNLQLEVNLFCKSLSADNPVHLLEKLSDTKEAFHESMDAWQFIQNINFGPAEIGMRHHSIQFWPDKKNHIGKQLNKLVSAKNEALLTVNTFEKNSISVKGLPAIERLLFQESALEKFNKNLFSCQVMKGISRYLSVTADSLHSEWLTTMLPQFKDASQLDGYFEDNIDASTALLKTLVEPIEVIRDLKLDRPLGSQFDTVKYKRLESWRSKRSLRNLQLNVQSLEAFFIGSGSKSSGLRVLLTENETIKILQNFKEVNSKLSRIGGSLEEAIRTESGYQTAKNISSALTNLHKSLEDAITESGIRLGFNSRDGD